MMKVVMSVVVAGLVLSGCSDKFRASLTGQIPITRYADKPWEHGLGLMRSDSDQKIDERTYKIKVQATSVTSQKQTYKIAMVHAADIAVTNGYSHFTVTEFQLGAICGGRENNASPFVQFVAHLHKTAQVDGWSGKVYEADHLLRTTGLEVDRPDATSDGRAKAFLANERSCHTGVTHDPSEISFD